MVRLITKYLLMAICAIGFCLSATAQAVVMTSGSIYKTVHKDGSITYSDQSSSGAVEVILDVPVTTIQSKVPVTNQQMTVTQKQKIEYSVSILNPQPEATIRNNLGEVLIGAAIEPKISGFFQLHINEQIHESATGMFKLDNMERGTYIYSIKFIDNSGKDIASSEVRKLYLHQASALIN